jgi:hypothetical protein
MWVNRRTLSECSSCCNRRFLFIEFNVLIASAVHLVSFNALCRVDYHQSGEWNAFKVLLDVICMMMEFA